jgi:ElaB/YqjD/DUF883 family membrane-anchored ribosome-binding protein
MAQYDSPFETTTASSDINEKSIDGVLKLLDEMAREKKHEIEETLSESFRMIRDAVREVPTRMNDALRDSTNQFQNVLNSTAQSAKEEADKIVQAIDQRAHRDPWLFVGGAALAGMALGLTIKNKLKHEPRIGIEE